MNSLAKISATIAMLAYTSVARDKKQCHLRANCIVKQANGYRTGNIRFLQRYDSDNSEYLSTQVDWNIWKVKKNTEYEIKVFDDNPVDNASANVEDVFGPTWSYSHGWSIRVNGYTRNDVELADLDTLYMGIVDAATDEVHGCCQISVKGGEGDDCTTDDGGDDGGDLPFIP